MDRETINKLRQLLHSYPSDSRRISSIDRLCDFALEHATEWYDDIPERGVLCWVSDEPTELAEFITPIFKVTDSGEFKGCNLSWKYATPLTQKEFTKLNGWLEIDK